ncbi:hypothetical protein MKW98_020657 [Papaver atlanticum]|uniref:Uncharacterized protein n=1 Tax=Papaver atlanticum TaxID=357466 RepID=A0AAD4TI84_9MAGN|nr:hypothetical protein MKW98_020657 [Papaver atlanticum]
MDAQQLLNLFDSIWFYNDTSITTPSLISFKPEITRLKSSLLRSVTEDLTSSTSSFSSPDSVLRPQQLQTINSGKEASEEEHKHGSSPLSAETREASNKLMLKGKRLNKMKSNKSLPDLEFEELKGFMDLGFVFSEEDKNSSLVSIIPGLQRLGKNENLIREAQEEDGKLGRGENNNNKSVRPYLSEAWAVLDNKRKEEELLLINWQVPKLDSEIAMKFHLRNWAHTVASAVR